MIKDFNKVAIMSGDHNITYTELLQRITQFASYCPAVPRGKSIILSENREGWLYAFFAIWERKGIAIPVDASSTVGDIAYILNDCTPDAVWTSRKKAETVRQAIQKVGINPQILYIDDYEHSELPADTAKADIKYDEKDTAVIIYTSGTTGSPKGVMLSFENLFDNINSVSRDVPIFNTERRTLILLPLHHVLPLQGTVVAPITCGGGVIICPTMSAADLMSCLQRGKVSIVVGVPRLWQTLYNGIKGKIDKNIVTRSLFNLCKAVGSRTLSRIVFKSVRTKMGGHIDYFVSGGAALDREIGMGLKTLGLDVLEGYGMTEAAPIIAFTRPGDIVPGCVGMPLPADEVKIGEGGEILARGKNVMQGYYNRPEETADVLRDGWLHTGDIGHFDDNGRLYITGRTKEIIVLSNGKNVNPSEIEYKLEKYQDLVKEVGVVQDGDMLRAIIVPQNEWAYELSDEEVEERLKREVLEPYNLSVAQYKKIMSLYVFRGDLPRTRMEKLQRFKLNDIIKSGIRTQEKDTTVVEPDLEEYRIIRDYIRQEKKVAVKPTDHLETDLAFDSLDKVSLQDFIEQSFGMEITAERMLTFHNVTELAEYVYDCKTRVEVEKTDWHKLLGDIDIKGKSFPATWWTLGILGKIFKLGFKYYFDMEAFGTENIPQKGPFIIAPNHQSYLDSLFVMAFMRVSDVSRSYFYAKEQHVNRNGLLKFLARHHNVIVMEKSNLKYSIQQLGTVLKMGRNVVIFPEGTRTRTGELGEYKKTFAILSQELGVPVVPVRIDGAYEAMPKGTHHLNRHKVTVTFLPPMTASTAELSYDEFAASIRQAVVESK